MKNVLITGSSGGMGLAVCRLFLENGYRVFGLDLFPAEEINSGGFTFIQTDLTDYDSVKNAYEKVSGEVEKLDAILHFSGKYDLNSLIEISEKDFTDIFDVNLFGVYRVNKIFFPLLSASFGSAVSSGSAVPGGRIIITSSELAPLDPLPFTGLYGITKSALEKYAFSLRMELNLLGVKVSVIRPGAVNSKMIPKSVSRIRDFNENTKLYKTNAGRFLKVTEAVESRMIPPEKIASLALKAAESKRPRLVYSKNRNPLLLLLNSLPDRMQNFIIKQILRS